MKLQYRHDIYSYPDVMVVCNKTLPDEFFETQPCVLVEVLLPSTRDTDLREKHIAHTALGSLKTYLIVESEKRSVTLFSRDEEHKWQSKKLENTGDFYIAALNQP